MSGTGGSGGSGGMAAAEVCPCMVHMQTEKKNGASNCEDCWIDAKGAGGPCEAEQIVCADDDSCVAIAQCVGACFEEEEADIPACVGMCAFPRDRDVATEIYHQRLQCFCNECFSECEADQNIECPYPATGGAGGVGGAGGGG